MEYLELKKQLDYINKNKWDIGKLSIAYELEAEAQFIDGATDELKEKLFEIAYYVYLKFDFIGEYNAVITAIDYYYDGNDLNEYNRKNLAQYVPIN